MNKLHIFNRIGFALNNIKYRGRLSKVGKNSRFYKNAKITYPENVCIGDNFTMHSDCVIGSKGRVEIGNDVTMSRGSQILTEGLDTSLFVDEGYKKHIHSNKPVFIADGVWLCVNSLVLPGVCIKGKGTIVAAGAVVTKSFDEDYVVLGGIPARIIKRLKNENNNC